MEVERKRREDAEGKEQKRGQEEADNITNGISRNGEKSYAERKR